MVVMMDMEISCKGHCEKLSHFLDNVSHTAYGYVLINFYGECIKYCQSYVPFCEY